MAVSDGWRPFILRTESTNIGEEIRNSKCSNVANFVDELLIRIIFVCRNSEVNAEEKIAIKTVLISSFREPVPQIAVQIAELIARIAR